VVLFALSTVASIIIPAELNRQGGGVSSARAAASRLLCWGLLLGAGLGIAQLAALPLLGVFTPLPEVRRAAVLPSIIGAVLQLLNGVTFVGEGVMVGTQSFGALAAGQVLATATLLAALRLAPATLPAVWGCFWVFNTIRFANVMMHHFVRGPLVSARRKFDPPSSRGVNGGA
jgi:Na+-driven multidrug efflux pump